MKLNEFLTYFTDTIFRRDVTEWRNPVVRWLVQQYKLLFYTARGLQEHGTLVRSAALTFYTLMSLVPIVAVVFAIVKGFGLADGLTENLYALFPQNPEIIDYIVDSLGGNVGEQYKNLAGEGRITVVNETKPALKDNEYALSTELPDGAKVVFVNRSVSKAMSAANSEGSAYNRAGVDVTPVDGILTTDNDEIVWTVEKTEGGFFLKRTDGKKLSKRHGATSVEEYRDAGYLPDAFVNYLALLGWSLDGETTIIPRDVLASKFSLDRISKNPATFDPKKLDWVNAEYINGMTDAQFANEIMVPELHEAGLIEGNVEYGEDWIDALAAIVKPRTKMPADAVTVAAPIFATADTLEYDEKSVNKGLAKEGMSAILDAAKVALEGVTEWTAANIDAALEPLPEQMDLKKRVVFQAVRVAVCGNMVSPPLGETMALVGRDDCLARIDRARTMAL